MSGVRIPLRGEVTLITGATSRTKVVEVPDDDPGLVDRLRALLAR